MNSENKKYWKGLEELSSEASFEQNADREFPEYLPINENKRDVNSEDKGPSRRDFLKMMGFGISAATLAACEAPVRKAIPYLNKPVEIDPGVANYYASTYVNGGDYCSVLVKTREGRPIKVDGNIESAITQGGTNAQVQSSVLSLYDQQRFEKAKIKNVNTEWAKLDQEVKASLSEISATNGKIAIVSRTVLSPSTKATIEIFKAKYPSAEHISYDAVSLNAIPVANEKSFGKAITPSYDFSKAEVIVSFDADFMTDWISPIQFSNQYAKTRKIDPQRPVMSRHYQFESILSLAGSSADYRSPIKTSEQGVAITQLYNALAKYAGIPSIKTKSNKIQNIDRAARDLWKARGRTLVVSGSNDPNVQIVINAINELLGNYGTTIDLDTPVNFRQGNDEQMATFAKDIKSGKVAAAIFLDCNPVYDYAGGDAIAAGLSHKNLKLSISTSDRKDETSSIVTYNAPNQHFLEQWNDAEPVKGSYSLTQPAITPVFDSRNTGESLLVWAGNDKTYYDFLRSYWKKNLFPKQSAELDFDRFWDSALYTGVFALANTKGLGVYKSNADVNLAANAINKSYKAGDGFELAIYQNFSILDGAQANNPWLQELPEAISKVTWENYLAVSLADAKEFGFTMKEEKTNLANVTVGNKTVKIPVVIQPGQTKGTVSIALGYGRRTAGPVADGVGTDAYALISSLNGFQNRNITGVKIEAVKGETYSIARTQTHQTVMGRTNVVQETTFGEYRKDPASGREYPHVSGMNGTVKPSAISLWKGHKYENHHWGLAIDLTACNGCGTCVVSCNAENNVPVVGKQEVINRREMHWLRIDRYYSSPSDAVSHHDMEEAAENPEVTFMPMMCQQCNNAPCETVCPVAATTHSSEGLNQMTYNRCIGTRYCANNCPYKVRRFNWFKYFENNEQFPENTSMNNNLGKMVLNPDVTVRSRGVMEKCSFCVQNIQAGKLKAKKEGRSMVDGDAKSACSAACSAGALVFGDMNDSESKISKLLKLQKDVHKEKVQDITIGEPRVYTALEEINVLPNVFYMTKIRNKDKQKTKA